MQMFINKLTVFLQLRSEISYRKNEKILKYELIPLGYTGDDERNLQSNHTPEN